MYVCMYMYHIYIYMHRICFLAFSEVMPGH